MPNATRNLSRRQRAIVGLIIKRARKYGLSLRRDVGPLEHIGRRISARRGYGCAVDAGAVGRLALANDSGNLEAFSKAFEVSMGFAAGVSDGFEKGFSATVAQALVSYGYCLTPDRAGTNREYLSGVKVGRAVAALTVDAV
jgi:hypothetical protein